MIRHIMKDGKVLRDIAGHVVRETEAPRAYAVLWQAQKEEKCERSSSQEQQSV